MPFLSIPKRSEIFINTFISYKKIHFSRIEIKIISSKQEMSGFPVRFDFSTNKICCYGIRFQNQFPAAVLKLP